MTLYTPLQTTESIYILFIVFIYHYTQPSVKSLNFYCLIYLIYLDITLSVSFLDIIIIIFRLYYWLYNGH